MTVLRHFWLIQLRAVWERVPIAWLAGVRRVGKTTLRMPCKNHVPTNGLVNFISKAWPPCSPDLSKNEIHQISQILVGQPFLQPFRHERLS
jgi:hypothetical protein